MRDYLGLVYYAILSLTQSYLDIFTQGFYLKLKIFDKDINDDDEIAVIEYSRYVMPTDNGYHARKTLTDGPAR